MMLCIKIFRKRVPDLKMLLSREVHRTYYDTLGLTPKATQTDIKKAYYQMSMVYHPDKGAENSKRFQEISTAYEVLGNNKLRKLYDKGLLPVGAAGYAAAKESVQSYPEGESPSDEYRQRFYENSTDGFDTSERKRKSYTGKSEHYDYDAWTQAHYEDLFTRREARKAEYIRRKIERKRPPTQLDQLIAIFGLTFLGGVLLYSNKAHNYDHPSQKRKEE